jgi:hypothetical protein
MATPRSPRQIAHGRAIAEIQYLKAEWADPALRKTAQDLVDELAKSLHKETLSRTELVVIAIALSAVLPPGAAVTRQEKRHKDLLLCWFGRNSDAIRPLIPMIVCKTEDGFIGPLAAEAHEIVQSFPSLCNYRSDARRNTQKTLTSILPKTF